MKRLLTLLMLLFIMNVKTVGAESQSVYQKIDPDYKLFHFSIDLISHENEERLFVYESPYGHIYDGNVWQHEERLALDLRRIAIDFGPLKNVPLSFGMSYKTYPRDPYASSFQINRVETSIILPRIYGFVLEYNIHALSNSGRQGAAVYSRVYFQDNFGLIPDASIHLISLMACYVQTNGLGWIAVTPEARGKDYTKMDWDQMFGHGLFWSPSKGWIADLTIDLRPVGMGAFVSVRTDKFWNDDMTQMPQYGKNFWRYGLYAGSRFNLTKDMVLETEAGHEWIEGLTIWKATAGLHLATSFE